MTAVNYLVTDIFSYFIQLKAIALLSHLAFKMCSILYTRHVLLGFSLTILTPFSHMAASVSTGRFDQNSRDQGLERAGWKEIKCAEAKHMSPSPMRLKAKAHWNMSYL